MPSHGEREAAREAGKRNQWAAGNPANFRSLWTWLAKLEGLITFVSNVDGASGIAG
jgi:hypothetical protein